VSLIGGEANSLKLNFLPLCFYWILKFWKIFFSPFLQSILRIWLFSIKSSFLKNSSVDRVLISYSMEKCCNYFGDFYFFKHFLAFKRRSNYFLSVGRQAVFFYKRKDRLGKQKMFKTFKIRLTKKGKISQKKNFSKKNFRKKKVFLKRILKC